MIKQEIIDRLAKKHRLSNRYAKELVDSVFELLEDGIKRDGKVTITRFGTFYVRVYKPKLGRDPRKGELFRTKGNSCHKIPGKHTDGRTDKKEL